MGGSPFPAELGLLSWVQVLENSVALLLLKEPAFCVLAAPPCSWYLIVWKLLYFTNMYYCFIHWDFTLAFFCWNTCWHLWYFIWNRWNEDYGYRLSSSEYFLIYFILSLLCYSMDVFYATITISWHTCFHQSLQLPQDEPCLIYTPPPYSQGQSKKQALNKCLLNLPIRLLKECFLQFGFMKVMTYLSRKTQSTISHLIGQIY